MAVISGADSVKFDQNRILYKKVDTLDQDGNFQTIFKRSNNPDSAFYQVSFSDLGNWPRELSIIVYYCQW